MDSTRDAVVNLDIELRQCVLLIDRGITDISNSSRFNHVSDGKSLNGLILGYHTATVGASDRAGVSSSFLVSSVRSSLLRH